jgi:hypothetical protein
MLDYRKNGMLDRIEVWSPGEALMTASDRMGPLFPVNAAGDHCCQADTQRMPSVCVSLGATGMDST